ncbi:DUF3025 domain-containing protein [Oxalicibacterium solurbis]|uniref:DUF3025 domain-containing protein n=1 Tax=Oxalicibacterium solurbis TaxID=69280 RepID=UPI0028037D29|nr:DUF3025 domain-containing protein [Oxalicibacterium solurbis]
MHVRALGEEIAAAPDWRHALNERAAGQALCNCAGRPIRFVPQSALPAGVAYEAFIHETGGVPTRDNLHDFFNALVWLTFPRIKVQLNALQAAEIAKAGSLRADTSVAAALGTSALRGKLRDAATIFDENAALLITTDSHLVAALRVHAWQEAFIERREVFMRHGQVLLFGHALMEKLVQPYKAITAHTWVVELDAADLGLSTPQQCRLVDEAVEAQLQRQGGLTTADFFPLPVLGVPGWWKPQDQAFYADTQVFRPLRRR